VARSRGAETSSGVLVGRCLGRAYRARWDAIDVETASGNRIPAGIVRRLYGAHGIRTREVIGLWTSAGSSHSGRSLPAGQWLFLPAVL
jgi:hypothetical protein